MASTTRGGWLGWIDAAKTGGVDGIVAEAKGRLHSYSWTAGLVRLAFAAAAGAVAGLGCVVLCKGITWANSLWQAHLWLIWLLPALALTSIFIYDKLGLRTDVRSFTGPNRIVRNMRDNVAVPLRMGPAMLVGTMLSLAGGASVGPDSAAKQLGASLGCLVARPFRLLSKGKKDAGAAADEKNTNAAADTADEKNTGEANPHGGVFLAHQENQPVEFGFAAATGLTACFAALLIAPLGVFAYTIELARNNHTRLAHWPSIFVGALAACAVAKPFGVSFVSPYVPRLEFSLFSIEAVLAVGAAVGVVGMLYRSGIKTLDLWVRARLGSPYFSVLVGSIIIVAIFKFLPPAQMFAGVGTELMHAAFEDSIGIWAFAGKLAMTVLALGFGLRGGEVTPLFIMGSLLGCAIAVTLGADVRPLAGLGLVALFGVCAECPVAAVLMGCEFFGFQALPWLALCMVLAWFLSRLLLNWVDAFVVKRAARHHGSLDQKVMNELLELLHHNDKIRRVALKTLDPQPAVKHDLEQKLADYATCLASQSPHDHTSRRTSTLT